MTTELVRLDIQQQMITDESINDYESTARFYTMRGKKGQRGLDAQIKQSASVKITERRSSSTFAECGESGLEGKEESCGRPARSMALLLELHARAARK